MSFNKPYPDELDPDHIEWLVNSDNASMINEDDLISWLVVDEKIDSIENERLFCEKNIIDDLMAALSQLDTFDEQMLTRHRKRVNPFELIGRSVLIDRAAVKLSNLDALTGNMFTNPMDMNNVPLVRPSELLYFASIEGYPGGFVDYMLWRKGYETRSFGITSKCYDLNRFGATCRTINMFNADKPSSSQDVTKPKILKDFVEFVLANTPNRMGVHVVLADGALLIQRVRKSKEIISKRLHLCGCVAALSILQPNGHFVIKLFDTFTPFTVGLIYLMYKCFGQICILKPPSSRPANAERYLICKWKLKETKVIVDHLYEICEILSKEEAEIVELVPFDVLVKDKLFFDYIYQANNSIAAHQIGAINLVVKSVANLKLVDERQEYLRDKYLAVWKIPLQPIKLGEITRNLRNNIQRTGQRNGDRKKNFKNRSTTSSGISKENVPVKILTADDWANPDEYCQQLLGNDYKLLEYNSKDQILVKDCKIEKTPNQDKQWFFVPIASRDTKYRTLYLSKGDCCTFAYDFTSKLWEPLSTKRLMLPPKTLVYGEIVQTESNRPIPHGLAFHIIDSLVVDGLDIRRQNILTRSTHGFKMVQDKLDRTQKNVMPVMSYKKEPLTGLIEFVNNLKHKNDAVGSYMLKGNYRTIPKAWDTHCRISGLLFIKLHDKEDDVNVTVKDSENRWFWAWRHINPKMDANSILKCFQT